MAGSSTWGCQVCHRMSEQIVTLTLRVARELISPRWPEEVYCVFRSLKPCCSGLRKKAPAQTAGQLLPVLLKPRLLQGSQQQNLRGCRRLTTSGTARPEQASEQASQAVRSVQSGGKGAASAAYRSLPHQVSTVVGRPSVCSCPTQEPDLLPRMSSAGVFITRCLSMGSAAVNKHKTNGAITCRNIDRPSVDSYFCCHIHNCRRDFGKCRWRAALTNILRSGLSSTCH